MSNPPLGCVHMVPGRGGMVSKLDLGDHYEQINVLMDDSSIYPCTKMNLRFVNTKGHCRVQVGSKIKLYNINSDLESNKLRHICRMLSNLISHL